ncbi:hypothetical protein [Yersinia phage MHG19]|nr:hypothetical protein [Yersinia phage MHG19]
MKFLDNVWYKLADPEGWISHANDDANSEVREIMLSLGQLLEGKLFKIKERCGVQIDDIDIAGISFEERFRYYDLLPEKTGYSLLTDYEADYFEAVTSPVYVADESNKTIQEIKSLIDWHLTEVKRLTGEL